MSMYNSKQMYIRHTNNNANRCQLRYMKDVIKCILKNSEHIATLNSIKTVAYERTYKSKKSAITLYSNTQ